MGKVDTTTFPASTSGFRLKLKHEYSAGVPNRIKDFNAPGTIYWTANSANARGQLTRETLGNGLVTNREFDAASGLAKNVQTGPGGGASIQNLAYQWDKVGNLVQRQDLNQSLTENFVYDNLHRLDYSQLNGSTNLDLSYDQLGNISYKSDVGNYSYDPTKKHAVANTSNGWSFSYDANGNMVTGRGQNITWSSYNYPTMITAPGSGGGGGGAVTANVSWTSLVSATTGANGSITKSGGNWYGGGRSTQSIDSAGGAVEFKVSHTSNPVGNASMFVTLHTLESDLTVASNAGYYWAIAQGWAHAHYAGAWINGTPVTAGDTLKISVEGGQVKFYKNGTVVTTAGATPTYPLYAYFYSYHDGYGLTQANITSGSGSGGGGTINLALNKPASGSAACQSSESWDKAVNGSVSGGWSDKWCSLASTKWLQVDLGSTQAITQFVVKHAQAGGEDAADNTKTFNIEVSIDGNNWTQKVIVPNNSQAVTTHPVSSVNARYVRLNVITPTQDSDPAARIYEFEVYGAASGGSGGPLTAQFWYDANRRYIQQSACYSNGCSTTRYIGDLLEKVTTGTVDEYRHMIRAGGATIVVSRATNGINETHYVTSDHLGSSSAVTSASGAVLMQASFGAFGNRRGSNWSGTPSTADWATIASTTRRGYTDHTMLDNLSLIHMNGRVMDPVVGRFVSSDPYIDGSMNTQGWNRFSYGKNSPFSGTDPSGFDLPRDSYVFCEDGSCLARAYGAALEEIVVRATRIRDSFTLSESGFVDYRFNFIPYFGSAGGGVGNSSAGATSNATPIMPVRATAVQCRFDDARAEAVRRDRTNPSNLGPGRYPSMTESFSGALFVGVGIEERFLADFSTRTIHHLSTPSFVAGFEFGASYQFSGGLGNRNYTSVYTSGADMVGTGVTLNANAVVVAGFGLATNATGRANYSTFTTTLGIGLDVLPSAALGSTRYRNAWDVEGLPEQLSYLRDFYAETFERECQ